MNLSHVWKNAGHAVHSTRITAGNDKPSGFDIKRLLKGTILEDHFLVAKRNHLMKELWAECEKNPKACLLSYALDKLLFRLKQNSVLK